MKVRERRLIYGDAGQDDRLRSAVNKLLHGRTCEALCIKFTSSAPFGGGAPKSADKLSSVTPSLASLRPSGFLGKVLERVSTSSQVRSRRARPLYCGANGGERNDKLIIDASAAPIMTDQ